MRLLILGYGRMGKSIEEIALKRGHTVPYKIDMDNKEELKKLDSSHVDAAIEFTQPEAAFENIKHCLENNIPVVSGTTGWLDRKQEIEEITKRENGAFFYATNFSIGVNIFFYVNQVLARVMNNYEGYDVSMEEIHHIYKKDAPSGTAITAAQSIIDALDRKTNWKLDEKGKEEDIRISAKREDLVPGTHRVTYDSSIDSIELKHTAHSREGFATGAVVAAEWLQDKTGVFGMKDMLNF